jgi:hypothetical protein
MIEFVPIGAQNPLLKVQFSYAAAFGARDQLPGQNLHLAPAEGSDASVVRGISPGQLSPNRNDSAV